MQATPPLPSPLYTSGDFTIPVQCSAPQFSTPLDDIDPATGIPAECVFTQDWMQYQNDWTPTAWNTVHPNYDGGGDFKKRFILVNEGERIPMGGGIVKWQRTYARVPQVYSLAATLAFQFPAFEIDPPSQRSAIQTSVSGRIQFDYFLVSYVPLHIQDASGNVLAGTGSATAQTIKNFIPRNQQFRPVLNGGLYANVYVNYVANPTIFIIPTIPTLTAYQALVAAKTEIVPQDSQNTKWMGNIIVRQTPYVFPI